MDTKNNYFLTITQYNMEKPFETLINQINKGQTFTLAGGQDISEAIIISKGVNLLVNTALFHQYIREWPRMEKNPEDIGEFQEFLP